MKYGGVSFTKLNLGGMDIVFANPDVIIVALWFAFFYFFFRYYQYFASRGWNKFKAEWDQTMQHNCGPEIRRLIEQRYPFSGQKSNNPGCEYSKLQQNSWVYSCIPNKTKEDREMKTDDDIEEFEITRWILKYQIFNALNSIFFNRTIITDYLLPFFFAFCIFVYCGLLEWRGNILNLLLN